MSKKERAIQAGEQPVTKTVPAVWVGLEETPVKFANQAMSQFHEDGFIISIGVATPPIIVGTPEQREQQLKTFAFVHIKPVVRLGLTYTTMKALAEVLQQNLIAYESTLRTKEDLTK